VNQLDGQDLGEVVDTASANDTKLINGASSLQLWEIAI
jgi:hypothetical protein